MQLVRYMHVTRLYCVGHLVVAVGFCPITLIGMEILWLVLLAVSLRFKTSGYYSPFGYSLCSCKWCGVVDSFHLYMIIWRWRTTTSLVTSHFWGSSSESSISDLCQVELKCHAPDEERDALIDRIGYKQEIQTKQWTTPPGSHAIFSQTSQVTWFCKTKIRGPLPPGSNPWAPACINNEYSFFSYYT